MWFCISFVTRLAEGLPVSLLELSTLGACPLRFLDLLVLGGRNALIWRNLCLFRYEAWKRVEDSVANMWVHFTHANPPLLLFSPARRSDLWEQAFVVLVILPLSDLTTGFLARL